MNNFANEINAINEVSYLISESNKLNGLSTSKEHAHNTSEVVMDAQVIKIGHEILSEIVKKVCCSTFITDEYCSAIKNKLAQQRDGKWNALEYLIAKNFKLQTYARPLLGSFDNSRELIEKPKMQRQLKSCQVVKMLTPQSEVISTLTKGGLTEDRNVMEKLNILVRKIQMICKDDYEQPIPYYKLVINPDNLMQTIDNAFQVAFLVSNGTFFVETDSNGLPAIKMSGKQLNCTSMRKCCIQAVSHMTFGLFKNMIKFYEIKQSLL